MSSTSTATNCTQCHALATDVTVRYERVRTTGAPEARQGHVAIAFTDATSGDEKVLIFGGRGVSRNRAERRRYLNDVVVLDVATGVWTPWSNDGGDAGAWPSARHNHTAVLHGSGVYVFGGSGDDGYVNDTWRLDLLTRQWQLLDGGAGEFCPPARHAHAAVVLDGVAGIGGGDDVMRTVMVIVGGHCGRQSRPNTLTYYPLENCWNFVFDLQDHCWRKALLQAAATNAPSPRSWVAVAKHGAVYFFIGGYYYANMAEHYLDDGVWLLTVVGGMPTWHHATPCVRSLLPSKRNRQMLAVAGSGGGDKHSDMAVLVAFGGNYYDGHRDTFYDSTHALGVDVAATTSAAAAPGATGTGGAAAAGASGGGGDGGGGRVHGVHKTRVAERPKERGHAATVLLRDGSTLLHGGEVRGRRLDDTWRIRISYKPDERCG